MNISKLLEFFKLKLSHRVSGFLVLLVATIIPREIKESLGIYSIYLKYRPYVSIGLIVFGVLSFVSLIEELLKILKPNIVTYKRKRLIKYKLNHLTNLEKSICHEAMNNNGMITLMMNSGVSISLEHHYVLVRASDTSLGYFEFPYRLNDYAMLYLKDKPYLLTETNDESINE